VNLALLRRDTARGGKVRQHSPEAIFINPTSIALPPPPPPKITERPLFPARTDSGRRKPGETLRYRYSNVTPPPPPPTSVAIFRFALSRIFLLSSELESIKTSCSSRAHARNVVPALKDWPPRAAAHGVGKYFSITPRERWIPTLSNPPLVNPRADSSAPRWNRRGSLAGLMARKKFYRRRAVGAAGRPLAGVSRGKSRPAIFGVNKTSFPSGIPGFSANCRLNRCSANENSRADEKETRKTPTGNPRRESDAA